MIMSGFDLAINCMMAYAEGKSPTPVTAVWTFMDGWLKEISFMPVSSLSVAAITKTFMW
jgi:hypothetical protein